MRIGIFDPYLDDLGGGEKYMMTIAQCLSKKNDVSVFWDKKEDVGQLPQRFSLDLSKVKFVRNIFSPKVSILRRIIETRKFDIIVVLSDGSIPLTLSKKTFIHLQQPIFIKSLDLKTKFKISRINKFFCNSYYSKFYIDKALKVESAVLYPPIKIEKRNVKKENIILHVGRFRVKDVTISKVPIGDYNAQHFKSLRNEIASDYNAQHFKSLRNEIASDYKKQVVMIDAFKKMVEKGLKDWKFVLSVSVKNEDQKVFQGLEEIAKGYPIEFLINKTNDDLWDIYSKAKIYWHASGYGENLTAHPEYAEHFGISTVEAMGAGAVPVVINAGGQKEIVENGKSGFLWNSLDELSDRTNSLIKDQNLWTKMSNEAIERSKKFTGDRFCKELTSLIENE